MKRKKLTRYQPSIIIAILKGSGGGKSYYDAV